MTYNRHAKQNDGNETEIVEFLRRSGASVAIIGRPVDLAIGYRGRTILAEVKNPGARGRLNKGQREFIDEWKGGDVPIIKSVEDAGKLLATFPFEPRLEVG